ncbi:MAG TPA: fibronectin type III domain-containing protein, partial [Chloroflexi bacterium]|nr:fibronectin type III domain-containing protein [Chloroflexota bacterium]
MRRTGLATTFIMTVCGVLVTLIAVATTHAASLRPVSFAKGSSVSPWLPHETTLSVAAPQIRVTHPLPGDTLSADSTVRVESNLPPEALIEVEFYLQPEAQQPDGDEALLFLGLDRDGDDGWSVPLPLSDLHPSRRYRVLALAVDGQENILRALGGWFSVHPSPAGNTWAYSPLPDPVRGESSLSIVAPSGEISPMRMDLYLAPVIGEPEATRPPFDAPPPLHYLGSGLLEDLSDGGRALTTFPYDSRLLPDGLYAPVVELVGNDGERYPAPPAAPFRIENALAPDVTLTGPGHAVTDEISLSVDIDDPTGNIERVDFYLEYSQSVLELDEGKRESMPHIFWLGSDIDGSDGWGLRVSSEEFWDGDHWHVLAVAYNSAGMSGSARSPRFSIVHNPRVVLRLLSPSPDRPLRGVERVVLQAAHGAQHVHSVHLFARNDGGALIDLGEMPPSVNQWRMDWDTRSLPDGEYSLVALVSHESGQSLAESRPLLLQNQRDLYHFSALPDDGPLTGTTPIRISPAPGAPDIVEATIYYRDAGGEMYLLPQQPEAETEWETLWDTATALDGEYDLVAHITHSEGEVATAIRPVTIHNATPVITLEPLDTQTPWSREREITWHTEHPLDLPVQVTIEYSPDGGYRWDTVAEGLPAEGSYLWDTRRFADSAAGRLRLTADDGIRCGRTISPSFVVNNLNQPPHLAILSPEAGYSTPDQVQVTWQTWSPTGSPLTIDLTYRQNEGERWRWLARRIADTGHYVWDISDLPANETYTLRVTARDAQGYTTSCTVEGISRLSRTLPHVELLWPNSRIRIDRETVILWEATGEDDERLLIDLYYSENAGQAWLPLAEGLPNTGYYVWQVAFLPPSTQYRIRVVARDGPFRAYDDSDAAFILGQIPRPQVSLLAPRASAHLSGTQIVRWSTFVHDGTPLLASVAVRRATGGDWQILAEGIKNTDFYLWDTTPFDDGQYHLRVTLSDPENATRVEVTETIYLFNQRRQPPVVSLISPQGGEEWAGLH